MEKRHTFFVPFFLNWPLTQSFNCFSEILEYLSLSSTILTLNTHLLSNQMIEYTSGIKTFTTQVVFLTNDSNQLLNIAKLIYTRQIYEKLLILFENLKIAYFYNFKKHLLDFRVLQMYFFACSY